MCASTAKKVCHFKYQCLQTILLCIHLLLFSFLHKFVIMFAQQKKNLVCHFKYQCLQIILLCIHLLLFSILHNLVMMFAQQKKIRHIFVSAMSYDRKKGLPFQVSMFANNFILHTFAMQTAHCAEAGYGHIVMVAQTKGLDIRLLQDMNFCLIALL